ncbi:hypothetical protein JMUB7556_28260 [Staphylococcus aureus]
MCIRDSKSASEVDAIVEEALAQDVPTIVDVYVDPNAAPLPGKIVNEEALGYGTVSYTHLRAHETLSDLVCRLLLEKRM